MLTIRPETFGCRLPNFTKEKIRFFLSCDSFSLSESVRTHFVLSDSIALCCLSFWGQTIDDLQLLFSPPWVLKAKNAVELFYNIFFRDGFELLLPNVVLLLQVTHPPPPFQEVSNPKSNFKAKFCALLFNLSQRRRDSNAVLFQEKTGRNVFVLLQLFGSLLLVGVAKVGVTVFFSNPILHGYTRSKNDLPVDPPSQIGSLMPQTTSKSENKSHEREKTLFFPL